MQIDSKHLLYFLFDKSQINTLDHITYTQIDSKHIFWFYFKQKKAPLVHLRTKRASSLGMTVQFSYNNRSNVDFFLESSGLLLASLADRSVHDKYTLVRCHGVRHLQHLLEQRVGLHVTTACVYYDYFKLFFLELLNTL